MPETAAIFISYRRNDAGGYAWALRDYLSGRFDPHLIFFDREAIEPGEPFPARLRVGVEHCLVLLAVIGPDWLEITDAKGRRRLDDEADYVRLEIGLALEQRKRVIPVLFGDDTPPLNVDRLPEPLKRLAPLNIKRLRGDLSEYDAQRQDLVRVLAQVPSIGAPKPDHTQPVIGIPTDQLPGIIAAATGDWKQLTDEQRQTIEELKKRIEVSDDALRNFFRVLGEAEVATVQQEARLVTIAHDYKDLMARVVAVPGDQPDIARLKAAATAALEGGDFDGASERLGEVLSAQDHAATQALEMAERNRLAAATTVARLGDIALTRLRYREAATRFAEAASRVPPGLDDERAGYITRQADSLHRLGTEFGDNAALLEAIDCFEALSGLKPRAVVPLEWAGIRNQVGNALAILGEREAGTRRLEEAMTAYHAALTEWTRDRVPLEWARTQNNLGNALATLGLREVGTARLEEAVAAYQAALTERTRERVPLKWATTQNNLGNALQALGDREAGTARLEEAVAAYRAALKEWTRERVPLQWAGSQNNLATALQVLGEREVGTARLEEAAVACRAALTEWTRERVPLDWAKTQNNLGNALAILGERETGTARLEEAVAAYGAALTERTRDRVPLAWAATQSNLGQALTVLGTREPGTARLEEALATLNAALTERTRERVPLQWATTQNHVGNALTALGTREAATARLEEAVAAHCAALTELTRERARLGWAGIQDDLGKALQALGDRRQDIETLTEARKSFEAALGVYTDADQLHRPVLLGRLHEIDEQIKRIRSHT